MLKKQPFGLVLMNQSLINYFPTKIEKEAITTTKKNMIRKKLHLKVI
jgi:hypothetical protein